MGARSQSENARVLVVDDDERAALQLREGLVKEGYRVEVVPDGAKAVDRIARAHADVVVLDIHLERNGGTETLERVASAPGAVPVVLRTTSPTCRENHNTYAADTYVVKSNSLAELKAAVANALAGASRRAPLWDL